MYRNKNYVGFMFWSTVVFVVGLPLATWSQYSLSVHMLMAAATLKSGRMDRQHVHVARYKAAIAISRVRVVNRIVPRLLTRGRCCRRKSTVSGKTLSKTRSQFPVSISSSHRRAASNRAFWSGCDWSGWLTKRRSRQKPWNNFSTVVAEIHMM